MNNVFDFKRFGKYFAYDLNSAVNNYWVSALTLGLLPLILLVFNVIFGLVLAGEVPTIPVPAKVSVFVCAFVICLLSSPVKLYGKITERRYGSDWLMLPASPFEKFLSMAIMLCIILPFVVFGLMALCDSLLGWIVPAYGESISGIVAQGMDTFRQYNDLFMSGDSDSPIFLSPSASVASVWLGWCALVLPFGLGAICFKKGKAAKTLLCIVGLEILLSIILVLIFKGEAGSNLAQRITEFLSDMTAEKAEFWANFLINISNFVIIGGLLTGLFFRVKTIKH